MRSRLTLNSSSQSEGSLSLAYLNGFDTSKAFRRLLELCNLRSRIVHGSKKRPKVEDRLEPMVYARGCLTSFYILCFNRIGTISQLRMLGKNCFMILTRQ